MKYQPNLLFVQKSRAVPQHCLLVVDPHFKFRRLVFKSITIFFSVLLGRYPLQALTLCFLPSLLVDLLNCHQVMLFHENTSTVGSTTPSCYVTA